MSSLTNSQNEIDKQLLFMVGKKCRKSFSTLFRRFYMPLTRFCYRYLQSPDLIEEVVNDTMFVVWQKAESFRNESRVSTWIMSIAARKCWDIFNKNKYDEISVEDIPDEVDKNNCPASYENKQIIEWALKKLSVEHRLSIELAYHHGYTCQEIADIMQCPSNTVKTRLHHARSALKKSLSKSEFDVENYFNEELS